MESGAKFFDFEYNTRSVKSSIIHFQVGLSLHDCRLLTLLMPT